MNPYPAHKAAALLGALAVVVAVFPTVAQESKPSPSAVGAELKRLQGDWVYISREDDAEVTEYKDWMLSVSGNRWQEQYKSEVAFEGTVGIDDTARGPKRFTLHTTRGFPGGPATGFAIYEIKDDALRYCIFNLSDDLLPWERGTVRPS